MRKVRTSWGIAALVLVVGCSSPAEASLTYAGCTLGAACDLGTTCTSVPRAMDAGTVSLCTAPCGTDTDCPGLDALCVQTGQADAGLCYRSCTPGCRPGTVCVQSAAGGRGACMP